MELGGLELEHPHCRFPVPPNSHGEVSAFKRLPVDCDCSTWEGLENRSAFEALAYKAWALLLRLYVRNDSVCFIRVQLQDFCKASQIQENLEADRAGREVIHCHVDPSSSLDTGITLQKRFCGAEVLQNRRVNCGVSCSRQDPQDLRLDALDPTNLKELDVVLEVDSTGHRCWLLFASPHIIDSYARSIQSTFSRIFEVILRHQNQEIQSIPVLSERNRDLLLSWNPANPFQRSEYTCMHHLIGDMAQETPDAEAICSWDGASITYQRLDELSSAAARRLRLYGVRPGAYVPFAFEKSMWVIVAMLGILKAGGAFVPLNVDDPHSRLGSILSDIKANVIVTSQMMKSKFQKLMKHVVVIDKTALDQKPEGTFVQRETTISSANGHINKADALVVDQVKPTDPVFVLFTSGSTGQPKGMVHDHASICAQWRTQGESLDFRRARILQFAAHTFDVFIIDTLTTLMFGGCICIPSEDERRTNVVDVINRMRVDYAILTPSFAGLIEPQQVPTLKTLLIGGEALPQDRIQTWAEHVRFTQIYGPAEVGICLIMDMKPTTRPETVGYPLSNASCWLVDPDDSDVLVPPGAVGELIVAGPSLAKGYLNNPAKTQAFFISAPIWAQEMDLPFTEYYKTGDILRINLSAFDGSYDFVGRKDSQIKLRGQRIEPGEVEYYLGQMPGVGNSMVTKPDFGPHAGELVAVAEMRESKEQQSDGIFSSIPVSTQPSFTLQDVRIILASQVPSYMLPSAYIEVLKLPQVPSMKIDRRSVVDWLNNLQWDDGLEDVSLRCLGGGETTALLLSHIISDILSKKHEKSYHQRLQGHDFRLQETGIDSIQVTSLAMIIRKTFGTLVSISILLDPNLTVSRLARIIDASDSSEKCVVHNGASNGHIPLNGAFNLHEFSLPDEIQSAIKRLRDSIALNSAGSISPIKNPNNTPPRTILFTGATGYLGRAILCNVLSHHPTTQIHVLIRCQTAAHGLSRLSHLPNWQSAFSSRIHVHSGDLSRPRLGLSERDQIALQAANIETVIHAGAVVHYSTAYGSLKAINVDSTVELLALLARTASMKRFVFVGGGEMPDIDTLASLSDPTYRKIVQEKNNGYTQSKIVAEAVVFGAAREGLLMGKDVTVLKPGYIIGALEDGMANLSDFLWRLVAGCVEVGAYPVEDAENWVFVADVGWVAQEAVRATFNIPGENGEVDNGRGHVAVNRVLQGLKAGDLWKMLGEKFGYRLEAVPREEWMKIILKTVESKGEDHLLWPLLGTLEKEDGVIGVDGTGSRESDERVAMAIQKNIEYLVSINFLPAAPASTSIINGTR